MMKVALLLSLLLACTLCQDLKVILPQNSQSEKTLEDALQKFIESTVNDQVIDYYPSNYYSQYDSNKFPKELTLEVECKTRTDANKNNTCHTQVSKIRYANPTWRAKNNLILKADPKKQELKITLKDITHSG